MIDLHVHTHYSDGEHTPTEVVQIANRMNVNVLGITDHDNIYGIKEAMIEGKKYGMKVIPGIEITAFEDQEVHVLGYNIDIESNNMKEYVEWVRSSRKIEIENTFKWLKSREIALEGKDVSKYVEGEITTIWHFAKAIVEKGYKKDLNEALEIFSVEEFVDKIKYKKISVKDAIELIHSCRGKAVLAHPFRLNFSNDEIISKIKEWRKSGLEGIEAIYSLNSSEENDILLKVAKENELGITIGSDYHGENVKPKIFIGTGVGNSMVKYDYLYEGVKEFLGI